MDDIKQVPQDRADRDAIRALAAASAEAFDPSTTPARTELETAARSVLRELNFSDDFLGYSMVAVSNAFWRRQFESIPYSRRLLLLPRCLSDSSTCTAETDSVELHCANCGACDIGDLKSAAEELGYQVVTAEGTTSVITRVLHGDADAVLGVACLDSLERSYSRVVEIGIPHVAVPLLCDGCVDTKAEIDEVLAVLKSASEEVVAGPRTYLPLLRETSRIFDTESLVKLLPEDMGELLQKEIASDPALDTETIALDWFRGRGKRLRPFLTTASYALGKFGAEALDAEADLDRFVPAPVKRIALAIEAMHKASLIHDDIEDDDEYRYGRKTIHREYGVGPAINIGDYLVGLGYSLVAREADALGAACTADILQKLSSAHVNLCRGQGAELFWKSRRDGSFKPIDALSIYSLKTAPALEVALYAGLRAAGVEVEEAVLRQFCVYLGEGYQVLNDLDDWETDSANRVLAGGDAISDRPTILQAFALEAGGEKLAASIYRSLDDCADKDAEVERLRALYEELGAFRQARRLVDRLRDRAEGLTASFTPEPLRDLMWFLVGLVLPRDSAA